MSLFEMLIIAICGIVGRELDDMCPNGVLTTDPIDLEVSSGKYISCNNSATTQLIISDSTNKIPIRSFDKWVYLKTIDLGNGPLVVEGVCFRYCTQLTNVNIGPNVVSFDDECFADSSFNLVFSVDPQNKHISTLYNGQILISQSKAVQMSRKFRGAAVFPEYVDQVGGVFAYGSPFVQNVTFRSKLKSVGYASFFQCAQLTQIILEMPTSQVYTTNDNGLLICNSRLIWVSPSIKGNLAIPNGLTAVLYGGFWGSQLETVLFPPSMTSADRFVFQNTSLLRNITFAGPATIGAYSFYDSAIQTVVFLSPRQPSVNAIPWSAPKLARVVVHCRSTAVVNAPKSVTVDRTSICGTLVFTAVVRVRFPFLFHIVALI